MVKLNVSARIGAGYAVVLLLLLATVAVGVLAIQGINQGLTELSDRAGPMSTAGGELGASLLEAKSELIRYHQTGDAAKLGAIGERYERQHRRNAQAFKTLGELAADYPEVQRSLKPAQEAVAAAFALGPGLQAAHKTDVERGAEVAKLRRTFNDMGDEVDAALLDLGAGGEALAQLVHGLAASVNQALDRQNLMAALKLRKELDASFTDIDAALAALGDGGAAVKAGLGAYRDTLSGEQGLMPRYAEQLKQRREADKAVAALDGAMDAALSKLGGVAEQVRHLGEDVKAGAQARVQSSRWQLLGFALVAVLLAMAIGIVVVRSIRQPLFAVVDLIRQVGQGDLSKTLDMAREDELGVLARGTNELVERLRGTLRHIAASAEQLAASAEQTSAISTQSHEVVTRQKSQTDQIATAMTEMAATVGEVAQNAQLTLEEVKTAHQETSTGQTVVAENIATIQGLAQEVERTAAVIARLDQYSDSIGSVLDVIRTIANQTNLLALNAAIEAARAGEQGRGFAVVADEVRSLAVKTQSSTSEIQSMIERLQGGTKEAVSAMQDSRAKAGDGVSKAERAGAALNRITAAMGAINDMSTQIASAAEEQSVVTQEMHRSIMSIADSAEEATHGARDTLAASRDLARLAEQLKQLVGQFRL
ncbi:MAG: methyl-accepting chemotaxis protein [Gammaproteobacteria bacterium]|nr:methyl-accepting chemotaxis protein [Gammaproteobacteria bacterium]